MFSFRHSESEPINLFLPCEFIDSFLAPAGINDNEILGKGLSGRQRSLHLYKEDTVILNKSRRLIKL